METITFESGGKEHTEQVLKIAKEYADKNGIKNFVIASTGGYTAEKAASILNEKDIVVVTHVSGFSEENVQQFPEEKRDELEGIGVKFVTAAHAFGGINRAVENSPGKIIANTLRMFCQGIKVCIEVVLEAADAGLVSTEEDVIAIAGTGKGADTVAVIKPATSRNIFSLRVKKILAKPL